MLKNVEYSRNLRITTEMSTYDQWFFTTKYILVKIFTLSDLLHQVLFLINYCVSFSRYYLGYNFNPYP